MARVQDLAFASQTRRSLAALAREQALARRADAASASVMLAHLALRPPGHQRTLKPLDFSVASIAERIEAGRADAAAALTALRKAPQDRAFAYVGPFAAVG